jgi:hypothetical protein
MTDTFSTIVEGLLPLSLLAARDFLSAEQDSWQSWSVRSSVCYSICTYFKFSLKVMNGFVQIERLTSTLKIIQQGKGKKFSI